MCVWSAIGIGCTTGEIVKHTARQILLFYAGCAVAAVLLYMGEFQGARRSLLMSGAGYTDGPAMGTGGYIDNLKFGAVAIMLAFIFLEFVILRLKRGPRVAYNWKDSAASFAIYLFNGLLAPLTLIYQFGLLKLVEPYALFEINDGLVPFLATFVLAEGAYYWYHRLSHEVPLLWAIHHTHHSARTLNLSIAFRLHTLGRLISPLAYVPMVLVGFKPEYLLVALALSLVFQFFIHTQVVGRMGPLEHIGFNTPSLHRVHHGSNTWCIDKNYGGTLMMWDAVFGTFQREIGTIDYGVTTGHYSYNPAKIMLGPLRDWWRGDFAREKEYVKRRKRETP